MQCDGNLRYQRCTDADEACLYDRERRESKSELRAEIQQLKKNADDNQRIIHALVSGELNQEYQSSGQRALIGDKSEGVFDIFSRAWLVYDQSGDFSHETAVKCLLTELRGLLGTIQGQTVQ